MEVFLKVRKIFFSGLKIELYLNYIYVVQCEWEITSFVKKKTIWNDTCDNSLHFLLSFCHAFEHEWLVPCCRNTLIVQRIQVWSFTVSLYPHMAIWRLRKHSLIWFPCGSFRVCSVCEKNGSFLLIFL